MDFGRVLSRSASSVAGREQQRPPLTALHEVAEIPEPHGDEGPHEREVPVQGAREPAAQPRPRGEARVVERTRKERPAAASEAGVRLVDLEAARDEPCERDDGHPMGEADDPVMPPDGALGHRANIFPVMRYAMLVALACVAACQAPTVTVAPRRAASLVSPAALSRV